MWRPADVNGSHQIWALLLFVSSPPRYPAHPCSVTESPSRLRNLSKPSLPVSETNTASTAELFVCKYSLKVKHIQMMLSPAAIEIRMSLNIDRCTRLYYELQWGCIESERNLPLLNISSSVSCPSLAYRTPNLKFTEPWKIRTTWVEAHFVVIK